MTTNPLGLELTKTPIPIASAPVDPSQLSLWQKFQQRLQNDPNLRTALLTAGLNMLRSPRQGETGFDTFAQGALTGVNTLDQLRQRDRAQQTAAADSAFNRQATQQQLDIADRRAGAAEKRNEILASEQANQTAQFEAKLAEQKRQFDARLQAGDFKGSGTTAAGSTGPERIGSLLAESFIKSGMYPDTEQGRSLANLRAFDAIGKGLTTAQDRMDAAIKMAPDFMIYGGIQDPNEAVRKSLEVINGVADSVNAADVATPPPENPGGGESLVGRTAGEGKNKIVVHDAGNGKFRLELDGELKPTLYDESAVRSLLQQAEAASAGGS